MYITGEDIHEHGHTKHAISRTIYSQYMTGDINNKLVFFILKIQRIHKCESSKIIVF